MAEATRHASLTPIMQGVLNLVPLPRLPQPCLRIIEPVNSLSFIVLYRYGSHNCHHKCHNFTRVS